MAKRKKRKKKAKSRRKATVEKPEPDDKKVVPYPDAKKPVSDFEASLDKQLSADKDIVAKRKGGRRKKDTAPSPELQTPDVPLDILESVLGMPFDLWSASQKLPELKLTKGESQQLAKAVKPLLDYYLPFIPEIGYAWGALVATVYYVARPRLELIAQKKKEKSPAPSPAPVTTQKSYSEPLKDVTQKKPAQGVNFPKADDLNVQNI